MNIVKVNASRSYEVKIGRGLLDHIGSEVKQLTSGKVLIVTDETVASLYLARVYRLLTSEGLTVSTASVPAGESSKSVECWAAAW